MENLNLELSIADLKKILGESRKTVNLYAISNEQTIYVSKLRIILNGFSKYLISKNIFPKTESEEILDDVVLFLQEYHLGYSEEPLDELDHTEFSSFFEYFVGKKWIGVSRSQVESLCHSLKFFIEFLREKLRFYQNESLFKKILDSLNSELYKDLIEDSVQEDESKSQISSVYIGEQFEDESVEEFIIRNIDRIMAAEGKLKEESEKKSLMDSIDLKEILNQWYDMKEINIAEQILETFKNIYSKIKDFTKNELIATIDYALTDILRKKYTQQQIAKRNKISVQKLTKIRSALSPFIPLKFFYPIFLSNEEINSDAEKTYFFKVNCLFERNNSMKIEMRESQTLENLHDQIHFYLTTEIVEDIDYDKSYSFYMSGKEWDYKSEYRGPPEYVQDDSKSALITLKKLDLGYRQKFLYLYDYKLELKYSVQLIGIGLENNSKRYPYLI